MLKLYVIVARWRASAQSSLSWRGSTIYFHRHICYRSRRSVQNDRRRSRGRNDHSERERQRNGLQIAIVLIRGNASLARRWYIGTIGRSSRRHWRGRNLEDVYALILFLITLRLIPWSTLSLVVTETVGHCHSFSFVQDKVSVLTLLFLMSYSLYCRSIEWLLIWLFKCGMLLSSLCSIPGTHAIPYYI